MIYYIRQCTWIIAEFFAIDGELRQDLGIQAQCEYRLISSRGKLFVQGQAGRLVWGAGILLRCWLSVTLTAV